MDINPTGQVPPHRRLVRIRAYLVGDGREVLADRRYVRALDMSAPGMPRTEADLNQLLEQTAREHGEERGADEYRLQLTDPETGALVMDWRYAPPPPVRWWAW
ncbi:hypothetical protein ABZS66_19335 [Dactylosporangium sp. NPDC005572]|uniref:hypothetical protein n=1 Tax=Dactylosporangium sp. NPDC005572 TaxID=3156889 RepID=UPI0033ADDEB1